MEPMNAHHPSSPYYVPPAEPLACDDCSDDRHLYSLPDEHGGIGMYCRECLLREARRLLHRRPFRDDKATREARVILREFARRWLRANRALVAQSQVRPRPAGRVDWWLQAM